MQNHRKAALANEKLKQSSLFDPELE